MIPWDEKWPMLRHGEVFPFPLATETNWSAEGWEVNVIAVSEASESGYAHTNIWTYRAPYRDSDHLSPEEAQEITRDAVHAFALRLREVLAAETDARQSS